MHLGCDAPCTWDGMQMKIESLQIDLEKSKRQIVTNCNCKTGDFIEIQAIETVQCTASHLLKCQLANRPSTEAQSWALDADFARRSSFGSNKFLTLRNQLDAIDVTDESKVWQMTMKIKQITYICLMASRVGGLAKGRRTSFHRGAPSSRSTSD